MINFNIPLYLGKEQDYIREAIRMNRKISGDGPFTKKCNDWFEMNLNIRKALLTTSCTHALEMAAILAKVVQGDEIIAPSYTFVSTVNAFVLRGAKITFVDIRPDTMNINEDLIENAITEKTKAIVPVHYAGVSCEMDKILELSKKYNLYVIEDAAQGVMSKYKGVALGAIGDFGALSFHETKNYTMGEGGALLIKNNEYVERAEIIREKGTNRTKFFRGDIDKYSWVDIGSSYLPSDLNAAYLYAQLENARLINENRLKTWDLYYQELEIIKSNGLIELPFVPTNCEHNAHMFYFKSKNIDERTSLIKYLSENGIHAVFHYIPLHSSEAGLRYGRFDGEDLFTTKESERIIRLPMYYGLKKRDVIYICNKIKEFYSC